jgi:subtilisin family serine protease
MIRSLPFLLLLSVAVSALAQNAPTHCMTTDVQGLPVKQLIACADTFPDDTLWHLDRIDQRDANFDGKTWRGRSGKGVVIYVVDTGVLASHDEFMTASGSRVIAGFDVAAQSENPCHSPDPVLQPCAQGVTDLIQTSHGTAVASAAAGKTVGVALEAFVVAIRIGGYVSWTTADFNRALDRIIEHAFDPRSPQFKTGIVSLSISVADVGEGITFDVLKAKMERMTKGVDANGNADPNGKRFFFSVVSGNIGGPFCPGAGNIAALFPATIGSQIDGIVTVGGVARSGDAVWSGSCRGAELYAPAEEMLVATTSGPNHYRGGGILATSGTSWSAPMVAGLAARLLEINPSLTPAQLEAQLKGSSVPLASGEGNIPLSLAPSQIGKARGVRH